MNRTESNMIAEFIGMKFQHTSIDSHNNEQYSYSLPDVLSLQVYGYTGATCFLDDQFEKSWDWLMPVIEKIAGLRLKYRNVEEYFSPFPQTFGMKNEDGLFMFRFHVGFLHCHETLIGSAYSAVVEFVKMEADELLKGGDDNE